MYHALCIIIHVSCIIHHHVPCIICIMHHVSWVYHVSCINGTVQLFLQVNLQSCCMFSQSCLLYARCHNHASRQQLWAVHGNTIAYVFECLHTALVPQGRTCPMQICLLQTCDAVNLWYFRLPCPRPCCASAGNCLAVTTVSSLNRAHGSLSSSRYACCVVAS